MRKAQLATPSYMHPPGRSPALRFCKMGGVDEWITDHSLSQDWQAWPLSGICIVWMEPTPCLTLRDNRMTTTFFCYKSALQKNMLHDETPSTLVSSWSIPPSKRYRRKTCHREGKTDSSSRSNVVTTSAFSSAARNIAAFDVPFCQPKSPDVMNMSKVNLFVSRAAESMNL